MHVKKSREGVLSISVTLHAEEVDTILMPKKVVDVVSQVTVKTIGTFANPVHQTRIESRRVLSGGALCRGRGPFEIFLCMVQSWACGGPK
eukprot:2704285-Amphidinium_carterae.1